MSTPSASIPRRSRCNGVVLAALAWVACGQTAWGANPVAISASAIPAYVRPTDANGQPLPETYVFMEGLNLGGTTVDGSTKKMTFEQITRTLAVSLAKQNYFPTRDVAAANLVIRIYWGTTTVYEDPLKQLTVESLNSALQTYRNTIEQTGGTIADAGDINQTLLQMNTSQMTTAGAVDRNAALLGYQGTLERERAKPVVTSVELDLSNELNEERYFVVLIAYDYRRMQRGKKAKPLWVTRLSVRSLGNNFAEAIPTLAVAGADAYGKQIDGLVRVKTSAAEAKVKLDELKFLGDADAVTPVVVPARK